MLDGWGADVRDERWQDDMPATYEDLLGPALFEEPAGDLARRAVERRPQTVLEVAAGTGILTRTLRERLPDAHVVASDLSPQMTARGGQLVPGADWLVADAQALPVRGGTVDLVACQFGLMFVPDRHRASAEAARVLRPGGALLLSTWGALERSTFAAAVHDALRVLLPDRTPDFLPRLPYGLHDADRLADEVEGVGLHVVDVETVVAGGHAAGAYEVALGFCAGTPLRGALEQRGDLGVLVDAVAHELRRTLGPGPLHGRTESLVLTAELRS